MTTANSNLKEQAPEVAHWTDRVRLNKSFADRLRRITYDPAYDTNPVTNKDAYIVYALYHSTKKDGSRTGTLSWLVKYDAYMKMNVRNQLCKMERLGMLRRVKPGVYEWVA